MIVIFFKGMALGAGLIIAIGSQNAFVLRQGLMRRHHIAVASLCALIDIILIGIGGLGVGELISTNQWLANGATIFGALFVFVYGILAARRALSDESMGETTLSNNSSTLKGALLTALGFSLLNPHVYLDTVILLGTLSGQHQWPDRTWFLGGAATASIIWFYSLAFAATKLTPLFKTPTTWKVLDTSIAIIMFWIAASLLIERFY